MKKVFNPPSVRRPFGHYNHGLLVPPGASLLVTSGQLGIRPDDTIPPMSPARPSCASRRSRPSWKRLT